MSNPKNLSFLSNQLNYQTPGDGQIRLISVPQQGIKGDYEILSAILFLTDDNGNGTLASVYPNVASNDAIGFVLPQSVANQLANQGLNIPSGVGSPLGFNIAQLGPGVTFTLTLQNAGVGTSRSIWVMDANRRIFVPLGYVFGLYIVDADDATLHTITANLLCQVNGPGIC